jgi:hypothetical protein
MIPGRFHAETFAPFDVPPNDVGVVIAATVDGITGTKWLLPIGDTKFDIQVSDTLLSSDPLKRPSRFIVDIVRAGGDRTARCQRSINEPQPGGAPGTSTFADVFGGQEYVDPDDREFYFVIRQNGRAKVTVNKVVIKGVNVRAQFIHDFGGFNRYSDGVVR